MVRCVIVALCVTSAACSHDYKAKVESDTSWSGAFSTRTVQGSGNQIVDIDNDDDGVVCVAVQKQTRLGSLAVQVVDEGNTWFKKNGPRVVTNADFGVATACNDK